MTTKKHKPNHRRRTLLFVFLVALALVGAGWFLYNLAACTPVNVAATDARLVEAQAQLQAAQTKAAADAAAAQQAVAAAQQAGNAAALATAQAALDKANATAAIAAEWAAKLAAAQAQLHSVTGADGSITPGSAAPAIGAVLPPPWNILVGVGGPLLIGLIQEWRVRNKVADSVSIINGIEAAKMNDPALRVALDRAKPLLISEFTESAIALVDANKLAKPSP